jgi:hypothetical protein
MENSNKITVFRCLSINFNIKQSQNCDFSGPHLG